MKNVLWLGLTILLIVSVVFGGIDFFKTKEENLVLKEQIVSLEETVAEYTAYEAQDDGKGGLEIPVGAPTLVPIRINKYSRITSPFGLRESVFVPNLLVNHEGTDMANVWRGEVLAGGAGRVTVHYPPPSQYYQGHPVFGGYVVIDHGHGWTSEYGHMSETYVNEGQFVEAGDVIGRMGETGVADGIHLHYEVRHNGLPKDALEYWKGVQITDDGYIVMEDTNGY